MMKKMSSSALEREIATVPYSLWVKKCLKISLRGKEKERRK